MSTHSITHATTDYNRWLTRKQAAAKLGISEDTIDRRAVRWQETPVPFKLRYKLLQLNPSKPEGRRYFEADLEALLVLPPSHEQPGHRTLGE